MLVFQVTPQLNARSITVVYNTNELNPLNKSCGNLDKWVNFFLPKTAITNSIQTQQAKKHARENTQPAAREEWQTVNTSKTIFGKTWRFLSDSM